MIETTLLNGWALLVESMALIAIIVLAFAVMVRTVKPCDVMGRLGAIVGIVILLLILPAIIASEWNSMSFSQRIGMMVLGILIVFLCGTLRRTPRNVRRR